MTSIPTKGLNSTSNTGRLAIELPWPDKALSPNSPGQHWAKKARAVKVAQHTAWALTLQALKGGKVEWPRVNLHWHFHPKTANLPDDDNAEASCKPYRDGIAKALGIDDANFSATRSMGAPVKGGAVRVTLEAAE
jgi:crossover junction endodeoxyribonuclease RusA